MKPQTIAEQWSGFEADVLPPDAPPVQRQEMRRAFYAGAWSMLSALQQLGDAEISEAEGCDALEAYRRECEAFQARVGVDR